MREEHWMLTNYHHASAPGRMPPPAADAGAGGTQGQDALRGKRVLLVEDEVFIALDLQHEAEDAGAVVTYARTLAEALRAAREDTFDGAILDVTLSTEGTCEPVADLLREAGTPFLLHSGDLDRQGEVIAGLGAPIVPKPAAPGEVIGLLARLMARPH